MEELIWLLDNYWILRDKDPERYYQIKDKQALLQPILKEKLGYNLIINSQLAKVDKIPGTPEPWMGIQSLQTPLDYAFLMLSLSFLEEKGHEDQFVLSELTEYISNMFNGEQEVDWTSYQQRRCLVRVLQFIRDQGVVKVNDGDFQGFSQSEETEVLYESTGISRYFLRVFTTDITQFHSGSDILGSEWLDLDEDRGIIRRHRVYRKLLLGPVLYAAAEEDQDFLYVRNYRNAIARDVGEMLEADLHVHSTSAMVIIRQSKVGSTTFPENHNLSDIVLQLSTLVRQKVANQELKVSGTDEVEVTEIQFLKLVEQCREMFSVGWYKTYRDLSVDKLVSELLDYMVKWRMLSLDPRLRSIKILPLAVKLSGDYPESFRLKDED